MSTEEKYQIALKTIYNTLKMREWEFTLKDKAIIRYLMITTYFIAYINYLAINNCSAYTILKKHRKTVFSQVAKYGISYRKGDMA